MSKNGQISWSDNHANTLHYLPAPCARPGPTTYACARITDVKSTWDLFLTDELLQLIVQYTNLEGIHQFSEGERDKAPAVQCILSKS